MRREGRVLLGSLKARFPFGLLVIAAPESEDPHSDWDAATQPVHARPDSLYVGVQQAASGLVSIECFKGALETDITGLSRLFSGHLLLPSARVLLYEPNETIRLMLPTESTRVSCHLYCDDTDDPATLVIHLEP
jgi:hypothetical protein